ncbi:MAG: hypothetical protein CTR54_07990 [Rhizobium sp.]|nr:MAG: hypothetical protein CTR54_07990 [Rhizobium sp.]
MRSHSVQGRPLSISRGTPGDHGAIGRERVAVEKRRQLVAPAPDPPAHHRPVVRIIAQHGGGDLEGGILQFAGLRIGRGVGLGVQQQDDERRPHPRIERFETGPLRFRQLMDAPGTEGGRFRVDIAAGAAAPAGADRAGAHRHAEQFRRARHQRLPDVIVDLGDFGVRQFDGFVHGFSPLPGLAGSRRAAAPLCAPSSKGTGFRRPGLSPSGFSGLLHSPGKPGRTGRCQLPRKISLCGTFQRPVRRFLPRDFDLSAAPALAGDF